MTSIRRFTCDDMFRFNSLNLDPLTETYNLGFYLQYMAIWPNYFSVCESPSGAMMGYVMGKAEGHGKEWHGHVTALTVGPDYRRLGLGGLMMGMLERVSEYIYNGYFVDLFVRVSNDVAINMYTKLGYIVYRRVIGYYSGTVEEDAFDMRKALPRDVHKESVVPLPHPVYPDDL
eukprot:comp19778_c0_seq1/m.23696 comp19778_c0_seq1/g.23696  ORF comp19778_c0_seq1/g.23696 comp19778_c0_seq1/m.23696 type:complete len:174 (-) comp19778_c0_seq1:47-568(-)